MALNFPANPGAQNPINTYSPTSTPDFTTNGATYVWTGNAWTGSVDGVGVSVTSSATPPTDANPNDLWFNTDNGKLYIYYKDVDSEQWVDTSADSTSSLVIVSETPPPNPVQGELWWDSSTTGGILYIYYTDPDSNQWVEVGGNGDGGSGGGATVSSGPNPPDNPAINTLWFNTETGKLYIYYQDNDSAQWVDTDVGGSTEAMPTGGGSDKVFYENDQNIKSDFTLDENTNAMTAGPITVDDGVSVTIPAGQTWTVVGGATGGGSGGGGGDSGFWQRQGTSLSPENAGDDVGTTGNIAGNQGTFSGRVIAGDYDASFSDKTGVRVGFDGQISVQNPVGSSGSYAYDVLSGNTPTFAVLGTGETRIGGDVTGGSANITLNPTGDITAAGNVSVAGVIDAGASDLDSYGLFIQNNKSTRSTIISKNFGNGNVFEGRNPSNDGTIFLKNDGSAAFAGSITAAGTITADDVRAADGDAGFRVAWGGADIGDSTYLGFRINGASQAFAHYNNAKAKATTTIDINGNIDTEGTVTAKNLSPSGNTFAGYYSGGDTDNLSFAVDANGNINVGVAGKVNVAEDSASACGAQVGSFVNGGNFISQYTSDSGTISEAFAAYRGSTRTVSILSTGSATLSGYCQVNRTSSSATLFEGITNGVQKFYVMGNGDARFSGTVTENATRSGSIEILLEQDNPANYVSTTNAEGETESVYNGPTLDMKKVGLALVALKAAAAASTDYASLKSAIATALADL